MMFLILTLLGMVQAQAIEFQWLEPANTQVIVLRDPMVDMALRVAAIDRATQSIDSITYVQGTDDAVGLPLLQAFRRAQARGVRGRYLTGGLGALAHDTENLFTKMLADSKLKKPAEVVVFGAFRALFTAFGIFDMPHEKILIIDEGTPNETIFIGGRNYFKNTSSDIDTAFVLRRLDPTKPWVGEQIRQIFENTWDPASRTFHPPVPRQIAASELPAADKSAVVPLRQEASRARFAELNALLSRPVDLSASPSPHEERPARLRMISNDFLGRVLTGIYSGIERRMREVHDDIIEVASPVVARGKKIRICVMSVYLPVELKNAIKTALKNGAEVELFTNSRETHATQVPQGLPYLGGLKDLLELMEVEGGRLNVYVLDERLLKAHADLYPLVNYTHRKLIVVDDQVFSGSGNFNEMSRTRNSEMVLHADDPKFASRLMAAIDDDRKVFSRLSCEQALTDSRGFNVIQRGLNRLLMPLY